jgi:hypothetical protein
MRVKPRLGYTLQKVATVRREGASTDRSIAVPTQQGGFGRRPGDRQSLATKLALVGLASAENAGQEIKGDVASPLRMSAISAGPCEGLETDAGLNCQCRVAFQNERCGLLRSVADRCGFIVRSSGASSPAPSAYSLRRAEFRLGYRIACMARMSRAAMPDCPVPVTFARYERHVHRTESHLPQRTIASGRNAPLTSIDSEPQARQVAID